MSIYEIYESIAQEVSQIARGKVWCIACKRMQCVDGVEALRYGWPKCCGATMTIDSPQWRAAHAKKKPNVELTGDGRTRAASGSAPG